MLTDKHFVLSEVAHRAYD